MMWLGSSCHTQRSREEPTAWLHDIPVKYLMQQQKFALNYRDTFNINCHLGRMGMYDAEEAVMILTLGLYYIP
jgi:hypothetical protein